ncbi:MAG: hypothetical protein WCJ75_08170 [Desulfomonile sp.]
MKTALVELLPVSDFMPTWSRDIDTKKPARTEKLERSTFPEIRIHTADTFCHDFPDQYRVTAFSFAGGGLTLQARKPVTIYVAQGENLWFAENDRLDIYATGATADTAIREFEAHLLSFYRHYAALGTSEGMGEALRVKKLFQESFIEVPNESGSEDG